MRTVVSVADPVCLEAVRKYAAELEAFGLPVRVEEIQVDDGWTRETAVRIDWGTTQAAGYDWEFEDDHLFDEALGDEEEGTPSRLAEHYLRTVRFLAHNAEAARAWIGRARRLPKRKPR